MRLSQNWQFALEEDFAANGKGKSEERKRGLIGSQQDLHCSIVSHDSDFCATQTAS